MLLLVSLVVTATGAYYRHGSQRDLRAFAQLSQLDLKSAKNSERGWLNARVSPLSATLDAPLNGRQVAWWKLEEIHHWEKRARCRGCSAAGIWRSESEILRSEWPRDPLLISADGETASLHPNWKDQIKAHKPFDGSPVEGAASGFVNSFSTRKHRIVKRQWVLQSGDRLVVAGEVSRRGGQIELLRLDTVPLVVNGTHAERLATLRGMAGTDDNLLGGAIAVLLVSIGMIVAGFVHERRRA